MLAARALVVLLLLAVTGAAAGSATAADTDVIHVKIPKFARPHHTFVTVSRSGGRTSLVLTAGTLKHYAGREIDVDCREVDGGSSSGSGSVVSRSRRSFTVGRAYDYCRVAITVRKSRVVREDGTRFTRRTSRTMRQAIALTPAGATYIARIDAAYAIFNAMFATWNGYDTATKTFASAAVIVKGTDVLPLSGPDDVVPPGRVGLWTDQAHRVRVVAALADGTQLYFDGDAVTQVTTTNILREIQSLDDESLWQDTRTESESGPY